MMEHEWDKIRGKKTTLEMNKQGEENDVVVDVWHGVFYFVHNPKKKGKPYNDIQEVLE